MIYNNLGVAGWRFLTGHARVLPCIARDPGRVAARHRGQDEHHRAHRLRHRHRSHQAGYVVKHKDGGRNRYQIQARLPLPGTGSRERAIGEIPALPAGADDEATGQFRSALTGERHRRHLVAPGTVITPAVRQG